MPPDSTPRVVLFDIGGVLVHLGGVIEAIEHRGLGAGQETWSRWMASPWVRRFECGECTTEEFTRELLAEQELELSHEEFLEVFNLWPYRLYPGARELVAQVAERIPVGCLSNNNAAHWDKCASAWGMGSWFEFEFLSHEVGLAKPDPAIYDHVVQQLGMPAERVLFLDDREENVAAAAQAGLNAHQAIGIDHARALLTPHL